MNVWNIGFLVLHINFSENLQHSILICCCHHPLTASSVKLMNQSFLYEPFEIVVAIANVLQSPHCEHGSFYHHHFYHSSHTLCFRSRLEKNPSNKFTCHTGIVDSQSVFGLLLLISFVLIFC